MAAKKRGLDPTLRDPNARMAEARTAGTMLSNQEEDLSNRPSNALSRQLEATQRRGFDPRIEDTKNRPVDALKRQQKQEKQTFWHKLKEMAQKALSREKKTVVRTDVDNHNILEMKVTVEKPDAVASSTNQSIAAISKSAQKEDLSKRPVHNALNAVKTAAKLVRQPAKTTVEFLGEAWKKARLGVNGKALEYLGDVKKQGVEGVVGIARRARTMAQNVRHSIEEKWDAVKEKHPVMPDLGGLT